LLEPGAQAAVGGDDEGLRSRSAKSEVVVDHAAEIILRHVLWHSRGHSTDIRQSAEKKASKG
jgi:hypothetical protein